VLLVKRGLFVGRFQPFHFGHLSATKKVLQELEELIIVIGSAQQSHTLANPFTAGERLLMIRKALEDDKLDLSRVWIVPVPDMHLHMLWVSSLEGYTPRFDVVYSNEPLTRRLFIESGYEVKKIPFFDRKEYSSTRIREEMIEDGTWRKLVPKAVANLIDEIDGVNRLKDLSKSDRI
jgi:nicotinamide-nucleotide adenylyltransferase